MTYARAPVAGTRSSACSTERTPTPSRGAPATGPPRFGADDVQPGWAASFAAITPPPEYPTARRGSPGCTPASSWRGAPRARRPVGARETEGIDGGVVGDAVDVARHVGGLLAGGEPEVDGAADVDGAAGVVGGAVDSTRICACVAPGTRSGGRRSGGQLDDVAVSRGGLGRMPGARTVAPSRRSSRVTRTGPSTSTRPPATPSAPSTPASPSTTEALSEPAPAGRAGRTTAHAPRRRRPRRRGRRWRERAARIRGRRARCGARRATRRAA